MKLLTGLFRSARKKLAMTHDNDMGAFREKLNAFIEQKDNLSDDEINAKVDELKGFTEDLPESDEKNQLDRFLEDFKSVKEQDLNVAKEAGKRVADLFEKLDAKAMEDVPEAVGEDSENKELTDEDGTEEISEEVAEETETPNSKKEEVSDEDPSPEYTLEEIYQFIKKRMAEDAEADSEIDETEDEDGTKEPESLGAYCKKNIKDDVDNFTKPCTTDNAPFIPVTMNKRNATNGGLLEMFQAIKNGGNR